jgi:methyl-accepting chemotaxis protein
MPKLDNQTILLAFAVVTGLAMLLQTIFLLIITFALRKAANSLCTETEKLRSSVMPVLYDARDMIASTQTVVANAQDLIINAQDLFTRISPRIESTTDDLAVIAQGLREQTLEMQSSAMEIIEKVRRQSNRLDQMFSNLLDTTDRAGSFVANMVSRPVRQVSNMLGAVKAVVESLRGPVTRV